MNSDHVVNDLILEGIEQDQTQKTLEIKTFTIQDMINGKDKIDSQSLFTALYLAFDHIGALLSKINDDLLSQIGDGSTILMRVERGEPPEY